LAPNAAAPAVLSKAIDSLPGFDLAEAISSPTVATGRSAFTDSICGPRLHTSATAVKSRVGS
jgi:hypothetical protein